MQTKQLLAISKAIRRDIVKATWSAQASHVGSALSCVDILTSLYFDVANIDPKNSKDLDRDRIILSKGHGGIGLLVTLAHRGFFPKQDLKKYCNNGSVLMGHTMRESAPGIEVTTGSLAHGLPIGVGMAIAAKADKLNSKVYVILSDGELDEGSNWEAIMAAGNFKLDNLIAIVDYNKIQSFGRVKDIMDLEPLADKWRAFKWGVKQVSGHDFSQLKRSFSSVPIKRGSPTVLIANTVKGKGVSFMEDKLEWHYQSPNDQELSMAIKELS